MSENIGPDCVLKEHPLWKAWFAENAELPYGSVVKIEDLQSYLQLDADSPKFSWACHEIRKCFREVGKNFSSRGMRGSGFQICPPETNASEMVRMESAALNALKSGVILGTSTPTDILNDEERRRHESVCERMAKRLALMGRGSVKTVASKATNALQEGAQS